MGARSRLALLPDDLRHPGLVTLGPDLADKVGSMELPVCNGCGASEGEEHAFFSVQGHWFLHRFRFRRYRPRRRPPLSHESQQIPGRNMGIPARPVEGDESLPDVAWVDVPAGQGRLGGADQGGPAILELAGVFINGDSSREDSFVSVA